MLNDRTAKGPHDDGRSDCERVGLSAGRIRAGSSHGANPQCMMNVSASWGGQAISIVTTIRQQVSSPGLLIRMAGYALVWWVLTGGEAGSWVWGVPAVLAAALLNPFPAKGRLRLRPVVLFRFCCVFIAWSVRGALDVGGRVLRPERLLTTTLVDHPWTLRARSARIFFANLINLMPGTLCIRITDSTMTVHVIGDPERALTALTRLEAIVMQLVEADEDD